MTEFDINEALAQEELEARAHEGDIAACFALINQIDQRGGTNRQEWIDCIEARFGDADTWELVGDLAIAFETLGGVIPSEWMDDAKGSHWLLSAAGIAALAVMREALQPEPCVSVDGVWRVRQNDDLLKTIEECGYWAALQQIAPASLGQEFRAVSESTPLDTAVEFSTRLRIPWPLVTERARAGDLTAIVLLCDHLIIASEDPDDEFTDVEEWCLDNDCDPYSAWIDFVEYPDTIDDNRLAAAAEAFEKNGQLLPVSWGYGPEACHLLLGEEGWSAAYKLVEWASEVPGAGELFARGGWIAFATSEAEHFKLSGGVQLLDADLGPFKYEIDQHFEELQSLGFEAW
jgi:hypothetical protein